MPNYGGERWTNRGRWPPTKARTPMGWNWLTMPEIVDRIITAFIVGLAFAAAGRIVRRGHERR
jgi:hypothetical protein